jgi:hypothetical protein
VLFFTPSDFDPAMAGSPSAGGSGHLIGSRRGVMILHSPKWYLWVFIFSLSSPRCIFRESCQKLLIEPGIITSHIYHMMVAIFTRVPRAHQENIALSNTMGVTYVQILIITEVQIIFFTPSFSLLSYHKNPGHESQ